MKAHTTLVLTLHFVLLVSMCRAGPIPVTSSEDLVHVEDAAASDTENMRRSVGSEIQFVNPTAKSDDSMMVRCGLDGRMPCTPDEDDVSRPSYETSVLDKETLNGKDSPNLGDNDPTHSGDVTSKQEDQRDANIKNSDTQPKTACNVRYCPFVPTDESIMSGLDLLVPARLEDNIASHREQGRWPSIMDRIPRSANVEMMHRPSMSRAFPQNYDGTTTEGRDETSARNTTWRNFVEYLKTLKTKWLE